MDLVRRLTVAIPDELYAEVKRRARSVVPPRTYSSEVVLAIMAAYGIEATNEGLRSLAAREAGE